MDVQNPKGPTVTFFGTLRLFKILIFRLILGFLDICPLNLYIQTICFNTIRIYFRCKLRFTKEEVEVRKYRAVSEF